MRAVEFQGVKQKVSNALKDSGYFSLAITERGRCIGAKHSSGNCFAVALPSKMNDVAVRSVCQAFVDFAKQMKAA